MRESWGATNIVRIASNEKFSGWFCTNEGASWTVFFLCLIKVHVPSSNHHWFGPPPPPIRFYLGWHLPLLNLGTQTERRGYVPPGSSPPTLLQPGLPRQSLSSGFTGNTSKSESEPPVVSFSDLPHLGRFVQSANSTPPDFSLPGPSSFTPCIHYPTPIPLPTDLQFSPPHTFPLMVDPSANHPRGGSLPLPIHIQHVPLDCNSVMKMIDSSLTSVHPFLADALPLLPFAFAPEA
ncbi:hypothetical protein BDM02DRAFT_3118221 [Thelephora ganbajun]|uniref:Uncharacterized protein n=1 Tax=Thelephora ganbajun TaxID=370292 RepID=A0ACB6ZB70_THEGA|nr:hypothetical protein BDM02DRAFT_3118221 [Thelephora ganbajun]